MKGVPLNGRAQLISLRPSTHFIAISHPPLLSDSTLKIDGRVTHYVREAVSLVEHRGLNPLPLFLDGTLLGDDSGFSKSDQS